MFNCKRYFFIVCSGLLWIFSTNVIWAVESYLRDSTHRGSNRSISISISFPENRIGNGIYLEKKLLDSHSQRVILKIVNIKSTESHVYLFRDQNGVLGLNIVKNEEDRDARFWQIDPEFYQYSNNITGLKRIFRIFQNDIQPILPYLRTGSGVTSAATHVIFYHIADSKEVIRLNASGQEIKTRLYSFRLHVINRKLGRF